MTYLKYFLLPVLFLSACHGRHDDFANQYAQRNAAKVLGIESGKNTVVVFGAAWCIPCRHEISILNRGSEILGQDFAIVTFLVEGSAPGMQPTASDVQDYTHNGEQKFTVKTDHDWRRYQQFAAGKKLPLLLLVDEQGALVHLYDQSLRDETELVMLVKNHLPESSTSEIIAEQEDADHTLHTNIMPEADQPKVTGKRSPDSDCDDLKPVVSAQDFASFNESICEDFRQGIRTAWENFFTSEDGEFFAAADYPLAEASVTVPSNDFNAIIVSYNKIKDGTKCTLELLLQTDGKFEFINASCVPIG